MMSRMFGRGGAGVGGGVRGGGGGGGGASGESGGAGGGDNGGTAGFGSAAAHECASCGVGGSTRGGGCLRSSIRWSCEHVSRPIHTSKKARRIRNGGPIFIMVFPFLSRDSALPCLSSWGRDREVSKIGVFFLEVSPWGQISMLRGAWTKPRTTCCRG